MAELITHAQDFLSALTWYLSRYVAVVIFFYALSPMFETAAFIARLLASLLAVVICALYGIFASIVLSILGKSQIAQWTTGRVFKWTMKAFTGVQFEIIDPKGHLPSSRPAVFVGNHQTAVDVLMLGTMFPKYCSVTAKASLKWYPFLGQFMALSGTVFIDRANSKDARQAMSGAAEAIRSRRQSVFMFPEGTRSNSQDPMLLDFKKGAFHLAVQAGIPIVPVVVANYSHIYSTAKRTFHSGKIPARVLDPIPTTGLTADDVPELTRKTRELMLRELVDLTAQVRGQPLGIPAGSKLNGSASTNGADAKKIS